jgi:hypothetical protein
MQKSLTKNFVANTTNMQKAIDEVERYEFLFEKLKKETCIADIEEIIHLYKTVEDTNEDLFRSANKLNDDVFNHTIYLDRRL